MTADFGFGLVIGICSTLFLFLLFRDMFIKRIFSNAVPMVKDANSGELVDLEDFKEEMLKNIENDLICSYKLLVLLKTTIDMLLMVTDLDESLKQVFNKKQTELTEVIKEYKDVFKARGIDADKCLIEDESLISAIIKRDLDNNK